MSPPPVRSSLEPLPNSGFILTWTSLESLLKDPDGVIRKLITEADRGRAIFLMKEVAGAQDEEKALRAFQSVLNSQLIIELDLERSLAEDRSFLRFYAGVLSRAIKQRRASLTNQLVALQQVLCNLFSNPELLVDGEVVKALIEQKKFPEDAKNSILNNPVFASLLNEILEEGVRDPSRRQISGNYTNVYRDPLFAFFQASRALEDFISASLANRNASLVSELIDKRLLTEELLKPALTSEPDLHLFLLKIFQEKCIERSPSELFILLFIDVGLHFDSTDIYPIACAGNYSLLKKIADKRHEETVTRAVFCLIEKDQFSMRLLETGLDPNLKNCQGNTLLVEAVKQDRHFIIRDLLQYGGNPLILDPEGKSVFELSRGKSRETRKTLYTVQDLSGALHATISSADPADEESALGGFLNRSAQGEPLTKFRALFIKVEGVTLALLKEKSYPDIPQFYQDAATSHPENRVRCWSPRNSYEIAESLAPSDATMRTLAFAIRKASIRDPQDVRINVKKRRYACFQVKSEYKTKDREADRESKEAGYLELGFKYAHAHQGFQLQTHGHGKNPEAIRSAFREQEEGIRLNWNTAPDLGENQDELTSLNKQMTKMFEDGKEHAGQLAKLQKQVDAYIKSTKSIIEARGSAPSTREKTGEENALVDKRYNCIKKLLTSAHTWTFNEKNLLDWQSAIHRQMASLQALEKKLLAARRMQDGAFETERRKTGEHLKTIREMIVSRSVTSSEIPTLKVYTSFPLVEDIFAADSEAVHQLKKTICRFLGTSFLKIPALINQTLVVPFLNEKFRHKAIEQLKEEAQYLLTSTPVGKTQDRNLMRNMQKLAVQLALFQDTSAILEQVPPVTTMPEQPPSFYASYTDMLPTPPRYSMDEDVVLEATMQKHLEVYASARELLDKLWPKACCSPEVLEGEIDPLLALLMRRVLLMDEEIRERDGATLYYPSMELGSAKRMLDEQLFLLASTLLICLRNHPEAETSIWAPQIIAYLQLRLTPSFHGVERGEYKVEGLFLPQLIEVITDIQKTVNTACESDSQERSPLRGLHALLAGYTPPEREAIRTKLTSAFKELSPDNPCLRFDPSIETLVDKAREIRTLLDQIDDQNSSDDTTEEAHSSLEQPLKLFRYLRFGETASGVTLEKALEIVFSNSVSPSDKKELGEVLINELKSNIRSATEALSKQTKTSVSLKQLTIDKVKALQQATNTLLSHIHTYLNKPSSAPNENLPPLREKAIEVLDRLEEISQGSLEKSITKLRPALTRLREETLDEVGVVFEVKDLSEELGKFFRGKRGKKEAGRYGKLPRELSALIDPYLQQILPEVLQRLSGALEDFQNALYSVHFKKLKKVGAQLNLGIREQIYYTTENTNESYILWDGKPFDKTPCHKHNDVHLPLEEDSALTSIRREEMHRRMLNRDIPPPVRLNVTHARNSGHQHGP